MTVFRHLWILSFSKIHNRWLYMIICYPPFFTFDSLQQCSNKYLYTTVIVDVLIYYTSCSMFQWLSPYAKHSRFKHPCIHDTKERLPCTTCRIISSSVSSSSGNSDSNSYSNGDIVTGAAESAVWYALPKLSSNAGT